MSDNRSTRIFVCKKFGKGQWSFIGPGSEKKWYSVGNFKSKGHGKLSIHFAAVQKTIETNFHIFVSANQLSLSGAVAEMCEEHEIFHDRSERLDVVMGQSIVLSAIKTEVLLENDDRAYQNFLLQQYEERIEKLSQQDRLSKSCIDAGFLSVVDNEQYFMTRDGSNNQLLAW